jgi:hypothetical protein
MADNPLRQAVRDVIREEMNKNLEPQLGVIKEYDNEENTAVVSIRDTKAKGVRVAKNVPVRIMNGVVDYDLKSGDQVLVEFHSGSPDAPYVSQIFDEDYATNTRENRKAPEDAPKTDSSLNSGSYEDKEEKRYMENGRVGIIHPQHKSTYRIDNTSGDAEIIASKNITDQEDSIARAVMRVMSKGTIESIAGRVTNHTAEYNIYTDENKFHINDYPINEKMAEENNKFRESILINRLEIDRLEAAIQELPGAQGIKLYSEATYGRKRTGDLRDLAKRAEEIVSKYLPEL